MSERIENLKLLIERSEKCRATHVASSLVREGMEGAKKPIWEGMVETFRLDGHATAKRAYAWEVPADREKAEPEYKVVLGLPPANSPEDAVKVAVVMEVKKLLRKSQEIADAKANESI